MPETLASSPAVITYVGDVRRAEAASLAYDVRRAISNGADRVALDLRKATYVETFTLGAIVHAAKDCREQHVAFCVVGLSDELRRLFETIRLDQILNLVTAEEWVAAGGNP